MKVMYTHLAAQRWTKKKLANECLRMAARCGKALNIEKLLNTDQDKLYNQYLSYRNKYILFYKK